VFFSSGSDYVLIQITERYLMKKLMTAAAVMVAMVVMTVSVSAAPPAAKPAPKTTGGVVIGLNGTRTNLSFEAQEPGRGTATWHRTGDVWANILMGRVVEADITGQDAWFTVEVTKSKLYPDWVGLQLRFYVHDGGTSGTEGDTVSWTWMTGPYAGSSYGEPVMGGNLQVRE
jgi:hypothetical protein